MRIKSGFVLRDICDSFVVVAAGALAEEFNGMIKLNETGAFLWKQLQEERTKEQLVAALLVEYDVDEETATRGVNDFTEHLREYELLA